MGCISLRVQSPLRMHRCVHHAHACVCACNPWRLSIASARFAPKVRRWSRGGCGPHARAVRGRDISWTKVKALPESLGQCKLLVGLCVPRPPPPPPVRVCGGAGAALLRMALPRRAPGRAARRWMRRRWRCRSSAAQSPARAWLARAAVRRVSGAGRSRPARPHGGRAGGRPTPSSRRCRRRPSGPA